MHQWTRGVRYSVMLTLAIVGTTAAYGLRNTADAHAADSLARQPNKPKGLPFNPDEHVGKLFSHAVKNFVVETMKDGFEAEEKFYMASAKGNSDCALRIKVATNSKGIDRKLEEANADGSRKNGFIVALLTNPDGCKTDAFALDAGDTAAWYVRFENAAIDDDGKRHDGQGTSYLVLLHRHVWNRDYRFPGNRKWSLGYCNHASRPNATDQALVLTYATACTAVDSLGHDAHRISEAQHAEALRLHALRTSNASPAGRVLVPGVDLALWFACGGDCCYSSFL